MFVSPYHVLYIYQQHLAFEAAKASYYGLSEQHALAAITSIPAKALGIDHRVGQIAVGYDADVLVCVLESFDRMKY